MFGRISEYWAAVAALGGLSVDEPGVAKVVEGLERGDLEPGRLHAALKKSKVVRLARHNLVGHEAGPLIALIEDSDHREQQRQDAAADRVREAVRLAAESGLRVIKGMALQSLYPDPALRHAGDVDLHAPDLASAFAASRTFLDHGWQWELPFYPWVVWDDSGAVYGQVHFSYPDWANPVARIDLHFGDYTLRHADPVVGAYSTGSAARIPLTAWRSGRVAGVDIDICDARAAIPVIALHSLGDSVLSMKDVNDIDVLIGTGPVDWPSVIQACQDADVLDILGHLLAEVAEVYGRDGLPPLPTTRPLHAGGRLGPDHVGHPTPHAPRDQQVRTVPAALAEGMTSEAARRYFGEDLSPRLSEGAVPVLTAGSGRRNTCWRLLPAGAWPQPGPGPAGPAPVVSQATELAPGLTLHRAGEMAAVVTAGREVFIPTIWGDVHPDSLRLARQISATTTPLSTK